MKNDRLIDLGLTGYEELFMSTEERLDAKKPKVEAIPLAADDREYPQGGGHHPGTGKAAA